MIIVNVTCSFYLFVCGYAQLDCLLFVSRGGTNTHMSTKYILGGEKRPKVIFNFSAYNDLRGNEGWQGGGEERTITWLTFSSHLAIKHIVEFVLDPSFDSSLRSSWLVLLLNHLLPSHPFFVSYEVHSLSQHSSHHPFTIFIAKERCTFDYPESLWKILEWGKSTGFFWNSSFSLTSSSHLWAKYIITDDIRGFFCVVSGLMSCVCGNCHLCGQSFPLFSLTSSHIDYRCHSLSLFINLTSWNTRKVHINNWEKEKATHTYRTPHDTWQFSIDKTTHKQQHRLLGNTFSPLWNSWSSSVVIAAAAVSPIVLCWRLCVSFPVQVTKHDSKKEEKGNRKRKKKSFHNFNSFYYAWLDVVVVDARVTHQNVNGWLTFGLWLTSSSPCWLLLETVLCHSLFLFSFCVHLSHLTLPTPNLHTMTFVMPRHFLSLFGLMQ